MDQYIVHSLFLKNCLLDLNRELSGEAMVGVLDVVPRKPFKELAVE